ncbi:MAG: EAL and GGDEF domain-containing protein [Proteobacteria bacterium]|nr:GGDEF domain-containing protein [Pseudomonadota bacterium]NOG60998.1 EAL and GGDEF domain-containing protein [Pseudomonadota bacterium]
MRSSAIFGVINRKQLEAVFQPILDLSASTISGYEALIRGPEDSRLRYPDALFEDAKEMDLIIPLEFACIEVACRQYKEKRLKGILFLNISPMSLIKMHTERHVVEILKEYGFKKEEAVIELSEKYPLENYQLLNESITYIRECGYEIAIDDLGAGYSSLRVWSEFMPEYVKIDRHFVDGIDNDPVKYEFVRSIQEISRSLGCKVIAEGIETREELKALCALGITHGQGYLLGRPESNPVTLVSKETLGTVNHLRHVVYYRFKDSISNLMEKCEPLSVSDSLEHVADRMQSNPLVNCLPVIDNDIPVGVITRKKIFEIFLSRYGRELHSKNLVVNYINNDVLIVDKDSSLAEVSRMFTASNQMDMNIDIIVTHNSKYFGVVKTKKLLEKITEQQIMSARHSNPLTMLPGNVPIYEWIDDLLDRKQNFRFAYFDLNNFKPYNDIYGYSKGDEVIVLLADILKQNIEPERDRIGHIGGDDFIAIFQSRDWERHCQKILDIFRSEICLFYRDDDLRNNGIYCNDRRGKKQFFPLLSIAIGVVEPDWRYCQSHHDVSALASAAKSEAKKKGGNTMFLSRRRSPHLIVEELDNYGT